MLLGGDQHQPFALQHRGHGPGHPGIQRADHAEDRRVGKQGPRRLDADVGPPLVVVRRQAQVVPEGAELLPEAGDSQGRTVLDVRAQQHRPAGQGRERRQPQADEGGDDHGAPGGVPADEVAKGLGHPTGGQVDAPLPEHGGDVHLAHAAVDAVVAAPDDEGDGARRAAVGPDARRQGREEAANQHHQGQERRQERAPIHGDSSRSEASE